MLLFGNIKLKNLIITIKIARLGKLNYQLS